MQFHFVNSTFFFIILKEHYCYYFFLLDSVRKSAVDYPSSSSGWPSDGSALRSGTVALISIVLKNEFSID